MSAAVIVLVLGWVFLLALTVALVLSRASREREVRRQVAADIRAHAARCDRELGTRQFGAGLRTGARIAEGLQVSAGFATKDASGNVRMAGDWRRSS